jgi:CheY-like chemotaxis protein/HPt (histidine-containing phosphotransfer) domain-containing protein
MLTAFGQHDVMQRLSAQRVSVRGVLAKPITPATLGTAVSAALRHQPQAERGADRVHTMRDNAARLAGARILLVEDNAIIQELALELLSSAGMLVSLAENGREALERLAKQTFDGVLMDCQMPVLDGYETTRALREMPHLKELPVIALTANAMEGDRSRVIAAGMNDHIAKPLDVALMFETLARWVRPPRAAEVPIAPAVQPSADDPLARLPGISAQVGRNSTMNNDKLYRRLLGMFRDGQRDVVAQFRAARSAGDDATAMRLAHNLRAVSASLGALAVQQSAGALERACADKSPDATVAPLLAQVDTDLEPVIAGLTLLLPPP